MQEFTTEIWPTESQNVPLAVPEIQGNEWKYIKECLDTNWVSSVGSYVDQFEQNLADYLGANHAVATVNGTAALHIALLVAGVESGDEVLLPSLTFIAPANAIRYAGAWPVFMDSEPEFWQMDPEKVQGFLDRECHWRDGILVNKVTNRRVKAILPVHILGHPCDMHQLLSIALEYDLTVIEDASESLGAKYNGQMVGRFGDIACFSFNGNKIITTGGGGMIVTDNPKWAARARYLTTQAKDDSLEYFHEEIGYNYRLTNIQAAMGVAQMEVLENFIHKKRAIARSYEEQFSTLDNLTLMAAHRSAEPTYWLYTILLHEMTTLDERKSIIKNLNDNGVGSRPLWHPLHALPPYSECQAFCIEHANNLYRRAVSLPSSVGLTPADQQKCVATIKKIVAN